MTFHCSLRCPHGTNFADDVRKGFVFELTGQLGCHARCPLNRHLVHSRGTSTRASDWRFDIPWIWSRRQARVPVFPDWSPRKVRMRNAAGSLKVPRCDAAVAQHSHSSITLHSEYVVSWVRGTDWGPGNLGLISVDTPDARVLREPLIRWGLLPPCMLWALEHAFPALNPHRSLDCCSCRSALFRPHGRIKCP